MNRQSMRSDPVMAAEKALSLRTHFHPLRSTCGIHPITRGLHAFDHLLLVSQAAQCGHHRSQHPRAMLTCPRPPMVPQYKLMPQNRRNKDILVRGNRLSRATFRMKI